jgi:hypothetical protein
MNQNNRLTDPVTEWLGPYLDGELSEARQAWVEAHLSICTACQAELEALRALSGLLHADPTPGASRSARAFAADVLRKLEDPARPRRASILRRVAGYLPLALFGGWAVLQAAVWISSALLLGIGYLPGLRGGLDGLLAFGSRLAGGWTGWLDELLGLFGLSYSSGWLDWLAQIPLPGILIFIELLLAGLFAVLFTAWMAGAWSARRAQEREI